MGLICNSAFNYFNPSKRLIPAHVKGMLSDKVNKQPIPGAKVEVEYLIGWFDSARSYKKVTATNRDGTFNIKMTRGGYYQIRVEAEGYYPFYSNVNTFFRNNIALFPIEKPQNLRTEVGRVGVKDGKSYGYIFHSGKTTYDLAEADIVLKPVVEKIGMYKIIANGKGGFVRGKLTPNRTYVLYNSPAAPEFGYKEELYLTNDDFCYFRTADGEHYGKMKIGSPGTSRNSIDFGFHYVYQPKEKKRTRGHLWR